MARFLVPVKGFRGIVAKFKFFILVILMCFLAPSLRAADDYYDYDSNYKKPEWYTVKRLERALERSKEKKVFFAIGGYVEFWRVIYCRNFPFLEIYRNLFSQMKTIMRGYLNGRKAWRGEREASLEYVIETIMAIATRRELEELDFFFKQSARELEARGRGNGQHSAAQILRAKWATARRPIARRFGKLQSITKAIEKLKAGEPLLPFPKSDLKHYEKRHGNGDHTPSDDPMAHPIRIPDPGSAGMQKIKEFLKANTVGQDLIIDQLVTLLAKRGFYQNLEFSEDEIADAENMDPMELEKRELERQKTIELINREYDSSVYFFGLPGNGKDTLAHAMVDAVFGYKGAWLDHMKELPVISDITQLNEIPGSPTTYVGSGEQSETTKFLIRHSGGRYQLETRTEGNRTVEYIVESEEWRRERRDLDDHWNLAFIYVNEWHDWVKAANNKILKQWKETGCFKIGSPNGGLDKICVKPIFIYASNWGINLLTPIEKNGQRYGPAPTEEELQENWRLNRNKKDRLINDMVGGKSAKNSQNNSENAKGISREDANRIPKDSMFLLKPLDREEVKRVAQMKLDELALRLSANRKFNLKFSTSPKLLEFVAHHNRVPDENARPVKYNVEKMIEDTVMQAIADGKIKPLSTRQEYHVDVENHEDGTASLIFVGVTKPDQKFSQFIQVTESDKNPETLTEDEVQNLLELPNRIAEDVVLDSRILEQQAEVALHSANMAKMKDDPRNPKKKAQVEAYFGMTSTGKTLLAKTAVTAKGGRESDLLTIDLSEISHKQQLVSVLMGEEGQPSRLTKHHDAHNGKGIEVLLDELSNASSSDTWMALYKLFREPNISFSDGESRYMGDTTFRITSNIGQEWFKDIPKDAPMSQQIFAALRIYQEAASNENYLYGFLLTKMPQPMIARIGLENIFFMPPLDFQKIRKVTQMKVLKMVRNLDYVPGKRSWKLGFRTKEEFLHLLEDIEENGFKFWEQGASIDNFVSSFEKKLSTFLMRNRVKDNSKVTIVPRGLSLASESPKERKQFLNYDIYIEGQSNPLEFRIPARNLEIPLKRREEDIILTNIHEAGHEVTRKVLFGDRYASSHLSSIPGIGIIGGQLLMYLGIAEFDRLEEMSLTLNAVLNEMAVLHAGYVAQMIVSKDGVHDAGKVNDMERATRFAKIAIVKAGLHTKWGRESVPDDKTVEDHIAGFSERKSQLLEELVKELMEVSELRALTVLLKNRDNLLIPLAAELARVGDMNAEAIRQFYLGRAVYTDITEDDVAKAKVFKPEPMEKKASLFKDIGAELASWFPRDQFKDMMNVDTFVQNFKRRQVESVAVSAKAPIWEAAVAAPGCAGQVASLAN